MRALEEILEEVNGQIAAAAAKSGRRAEEVEIIGVTKTHGPEIIQEAWNAGIRIVGENKVQEAAWKREAAISGPEWHLIGHLQRNKVRQALTLFDFFHSVDTIELIDRLQLLADEMGSRPHILLEVNMSGERSKSGFRPDDVPAAIERVMNCGNLWFEGFMTMAPATPADKIEETRPVFAGLRELRDAMEEEFGLQLPRLSMGMSGDYRIAVEEGATWVRLGTVLFGERPKYQPPKPDFRWEMD